MAHAFVSLRLKLTLWYLAVFAGIQVTLVLATVLLRRDMIERTFDVQLRQRAEAFAQRLVSSPPPWTTESLRGLAAVDAGIALCAVRNRGGEIVAASINRDLRGLPSLDELELLGGATGARFVTLPAEDGLGLIGAAEAMRLVILPFKDREGHGFFLQAASRAEFLEQLRGPMLDLFALGVPIGLFAACIPAWLIARRAMAPIRQISAAARRVSPDQTSWGIQLEASDPEAVKLQGELNEALERLEAGFRAQEQFVSNVSHELRTPITVLLTESQVLKAGQPSQAECLRYVGSVEDEMRRLGRLVESVLDLARVGLGRQAVQRDPVSVNDLVLRAVRHSAPQARHRRVRLVPELAESEPDDDQPGLVGNRDLLCTMLENLVRNAIRFSPAGESVRVIARFHRDQVQLVVRDRGPGIPDEYLDKVFERYVQAPGGPAGRQGTGLGLAIAREVAVLHGGSISAWNRGHGGCAFGVWLPLTQPARAEQEENDPRRTSG